MVDTNQTKRIDQFPEETSPDSNDVVLLEQSDNSAYNRLRLSNILGGSAGGVTLNGDINITGNYQKSGIVVADSGVAFPVSPSAGDQFFRTDLGLHCYYDGTRWLTENVYEAGAVVTITASLQTLQIGRIADDFAPLIKTLSATTLVAVTNDGANYWELDWRSFTSAIAGGTIIDSFDTSADAPSVFVDHDIASPSAPTPATFGYLDILFTQVGAPGNCSIWAQVEYRKIIT